MELSDYNGWENKFSWLVEMWVKSALENWLTRFPGRNKQHDESLLLFVWDLAGSALAYADWIGLMALLMGEAQTSENLFTMTLYRHILNDGYCLQSMSKLVQEAASLYAGAGSVKDWFEAQVNAWVDASALRRQRNRSISELVSSLIHNTYTLINWEHVARAFRPGY